MARPSKVRSRWFVAVAAIGVLTVVLPIAFLSYQRAKAHELVPFERVVLGSEKADVELQMAYRPDEQPPVSWWIIVQAPQRTFPLQSLNQLKGFVHIRTEDDALRFVRLRTCPAITVTWPTRDEYEVMTFAEAKQQYLYGLAPPSSAPTQGPGWEGVVSPSAFRRGGFQAPVIQAVPSGFQITRWLFQPRQPFQQRQPAQVLKVRESVGADGTYSRTVLVSHPPPALPGTSWAASMPWCCQSGKTHGLKSNRSVRLV